MILVLFSNVSALECFAVLKAMRGILAEFSQRLAPPPKYFVRYCLQLGHNCLLICFRSWFCVYLSWKQLPKVSLPLMRTLVLGWLGLWLPLLLLQLSFVAVFPSPMKASSFLPFIRNHSFLLWLSKASAEWMYTLCLSCMLALKHCIPKDLEHQQLLLNIFSLQKLCEDSSWKVWRFLKCTK